MNEFNENGLHKIDSIIEKALEEDIASGDITTDAVFDDYKYSTAVITAKNDGVLAGINVVRRVFEKVDYDLSFKSIKEDGVNIYYGFEIAEISGDTRSILKGERTALNFLGRMSGIATLTNEFVKRIKGTKAKILDTRKTSPNLRILEKYAVSAGGGYNHRFGLYDMFLIKDNHIKAAGGLGKAIKKAVKYREEEGIDAKIEIEAENIEQVREALSEGVDRIMLDNMDVKDMHESVEIASGMVEIEVSGNVNLENIAEIASIGVDYISIGTLTHSVKNLDFSLLIL
ncbi:carboxylating nicotinate-nucleotide diphosphorylase [candidate division KSB1 bacterium]